MPTKGLRCVAACVLLLCAGAATAAAKEVTIGYQLIINPWKVAIARGAFEKATGWDIKWRQFDSGSAVNAAMASGHLAIALAGSSPIAAGLSQGIPYDLFWIMEGITEAEALAVRDGSGIAAPQDLRGKKIAVPFVSTTHFHLLFALEQFGIAEGDVRILNMQPPQMVPAWVRGDIDAAFVWYPILGRLLETGHPLINSGQLAGWGKATFDGVVVLRDFADENPEFMTAFAKTLDAAQALYRDNAAAWTEDSDYVAAIVKLHGVKPSDVVQSLALYDFPSASDLMSNRWFGGGAEGGAARAIRFTAEFLKAEKKIPKLADDYGAFIDSRWAAAAAGQ